MDSLIETALRKATNRSPTASTLVPYLTRKIQSRLPHHVRNRWTSARIEAELRTAFRFTDSPGGPVCHGIFIHAV